MTDALGLITSVKGKVVLWYALASTPASFQSHTVQLLQETYEFIYGCNVWNVEVVT